MKIPKINKIGTQKLTECILFRKNGTKSEKIGTGNGKYVMIGTGNWHWKVNIGTRNPKIGTQNMMIGTGNGNLNGYFWLIGTGNASKFNKIMANLVNIGTGFTKIQNIGTGKLLAQASIDEEILCKCFDKCCKA